MAKCKALTGSAMKELTICGLRHLTVKLLEAVSWLSKDTMDISAVCGVLNLRHC